ncbi:hypothetical protein GGR57DRAFT_494226 [Xylariaceae sp. FL1272]|nr:hypothetical protein GGR57DRAFT_494226 [Xylariaceae sp. FL1272]
MAFHFSMPANSFGRPLGNLEIFFKKLSDQGKPLNREHWTIHLAMTLEFPPSLLDAVPNIKCAWQIMRLQHPELGAYLTDGTDAMSRPVLTAADDNLDSWTRDTFAVHPDVSSANGVFSSIHDTSYPTCNWLPASSQVVIFSSHWRIDGVGMCIFGNHFMTALAATIGQELQPYTIAEKLDVHGYNMNKTVFPKSLEDLARACSRHRDLLHAGDSENQVLAAGADALVAEFLKGVPSIGLPTVDGSETAVPFYSDRTARALDADTTAQISLACRNMGATVTTAVHAAIVRATTSFPQHPLAKSYAAFVPVDLRQVLGGTADQLIGPYFSGLPVYVEPDLLQKDTGSFELIARKLGSVYRRDRNRFWKIPSGSHNDEYLSLSDLAEPYVKRTTALFNTPPPEFLPPVKTPDLSSLGKLEKYIKTQYCSKGGHEAIKVVDIWMGTEMLNRSVQFHVWSWKGALNLAASFNTSFYEKSFVAGFTDMVIDELLEGCRVTK